MIVAQFQRVTGLVVLPARKPIPDRVFASKHAASKFARVTRTDLSRGFTRKVETTDGKVRNEFVIPGRTFERALRIIGDGFTDATGVEHGTAGCNFYGASRDRILSLVGADALAPRFAPDATAAAPLSPEMIVAQRSLLAIIGKALTVEVEPDGVASVTPDTIPGL